MNLGVALMTLGERESGTVRLEKAVTALDACLKITASVWPSEWVQWVHTVRDETWNEILQRSPTSHGS